MKKILNWRYPILALWLIATILFTINQPDFKAILNQKGQANIDENSPSILASKTLGKIGNAKGDTIIFVFNSDKGFTQNELIDVEEGVKSLEDNKEALKITSIVDPFSLPEAKDQLISKDNTTLMVQANFERGTTDSADIIKGFTDTLAEVEVPHYITGELAINNDYLKASNEAVDKSGMITIVFILVVLILMFRSVVTPIISLLAVGVSYLTSLGIIGILINTADFPITALTQMFVILVLFGIGTDYNILLFNRFKEELGHGLSIDDAIITTFKTAGKTVFFSGLTVFMAFASLSFVQFPIYRSANAVAIAIAVLLLELLTLTPILMKLLGRKLFWPAHNVEGHKDSRLWERVTGASVKHPIISLALVAAIIIPVMVSNSAKLSFDSLKDLSPDTPSVVGFNLIADKFGRGKAMPTTVVIQSELPMDDNKSLAVLDAVTEKIKSLDGVAQVSSSTQPKGEAIAEFYTNDQTAKVIDGLVSANDGAQQINDGLKMIDEKLTAPDFSTVKGLSTGTGSIEQGLGAVSNGLKQINLGIYKGAAGADQLAGGITGLKAGVLEINTGLNSIQTNLVVIQDGYTRLGQGYKAMPESINQLKGLVLMMNGSVAALEKKLPNDSDVLTLKASLSKLSMALEGLSTGLSQANGNYDALTDGLGKLNAGLGELVKNTAPDSQLVLGIASLEQGQKELAIGLRQGAAGQATVIESLDKLKVGAGQVKVGQEALYTGLNELSSGMLQLKDGIGQSSDGLTQLSEGISKTNDFLGQMTAAKAFYIPNEAFETGDLDKIFDVYMSEDRTIAKFTVNLSTDPYAKESIDLIDTMSDVVKNELKGTVLSSATVGITGPTAHTNDLNKIATHDISFTQVIVLGSIFVLLLFVIRSFWIPVYIIGSLLTAYYTALSVTAFAVTKLFPEMDGLSWNVPFFSFVVIAALGVDYSIFLMARYKEYPNLHPSEAIVAASKNIGGVVMSAAVILAGTFATLYPSNLHILMELAICVVTGLILLSMILLPIVIPALISLQDRLMDKLHKL